MKFLASWRLGVMLLFTACVSAPAVHPEDVPFRALASGLEVPDSRYVLIVSEAGMKRFYEAYGSRIYNERNERVFEYPTADFSREWLLGAFWEPQSNSCYEISFRRLQRDPSGSVRALVHHRHPREDEICAQVITYPQALITVPIEQIREPSQILFEVQGLLVTPQLWD